MKKIKGIHLKHNKNTASCKTENFRIPEEVLIPMNMNMGADSEPTVKIGDHVNIGDKIGDSKAFLSVPIHASVSGIVTEITEMTLLGGKCRAIRIKADETQVVSENVKPPKINNRDDFIKAVRESGLTGLGGAAFPTHVKHSVNTEIDTLIINAAECEPFITSDHRQMMESPDSIIGGIKLVMKYLDIPNAIIGIEKNKLDAIELLREKTKNQNNITIKALPSVYPQGAEKILIFNMTGRLVKEKQLPSDQGVIVMNVSTAAFIYDYCKSGMPLIERRITVDGDIIKNPCNLMVKIGTPVCEILEFSGCDTKRLRKLILGGPMMGTAAFDLNSVITKSNNALLAFEKTSEKTVTNCIRCGRCMTACPINLMPMEIERAYNRKDVDSLKKLHVKLCMNCGCCTYVCPAGRNLAQINTLAKGLI